MHYIDSLVARSLGTTVLFSGTSPPRCSSQKPGLGALGPASGRRPASGTGVRGRGESPEAFRRGSLPSDARVVARGGGAGGCGAWWLRTPSTLRRSRPQLPARPARPVGMEHEVGGKGCSGGGGRAGRWEPSRFAGCSRPPGQSGEFEGRPWVGWCYPRPSWVKYPAHPTHPLTQKISFGSPHG